MTSPSAGKSRRVAALVNHKIHNTLQQRLHHSSNASISTVHMLVVELCVDLWAEPMGFHISLVEDIGR